MKLSKEEAKAIKFILLVIGLSIIARMTGQKDDADIQQPNTADAFSIPTTDRSSSRPSRRPPNPSAGPLDPNTATQRELEALTGIGPTSARKIIAARPLRTLDDLANAIGKKKAEALKNRLALQPGESRAERSSDGSSDENRREAPAGRINLNRASAQELETLPGIGPALAQRIVSKRKQVRHFRNWDQVDSIPGIGPAMLKKLKEAATL